MRAVLRVAVLATLSVAPWHAASIGAETQDLEVRLQVSIGAEAVLEAHSLPARLVARPVGVLGQSAASAHDVAPVEREVAVPGLVSVPLTAGLLWSLHLEADGYWHQPEVVSVAEAGGSPSVVATALVPLIAVGATVVPEPGREAPHRARCWFRSATGDMGGKGALELDGWRELTATLEERRFRCEVPAGTHHLKVQAPGFVPHYFWELETATAAPVELGELRLRSGVSLVGEVQVAGPGGDGAPRLRLQPARSATPSPSVEERLEATTAATRANAQGFFQLQGIPPGSYVLTAEAEGFAPARVEGVDLVHEGEYVLDEPLVLRPPSELELEIDPATHPYGAPWHAELRAASGPQVLRVVARTEVALSGLARFVGLPRGDYEIVVVGPGGSRYAFAPVELVEDRQSARVTLPLVEVTGELRSGDEALAATLLFGGRDAKEQVAFEADEDGAFTGHLPRAGTWAVDVRHLDGWVQRAPPVEVPADRDGVEVLIALPDGEIAGQVVDEDGRPVAGAGVLIVDTADRRPALRGPSDAEGAFRIRGVEPGSYLAFAGSGEEKSDWQPLALGEGEHRSDLRLVVRHQRTLRGRVSGPWGAVPGARVDVLPDAFGGMPAWVSQDVSGPDGGFAVDLPATAKSARVVVFPPGHALSVRRVDLTAQEDLELAVSPEGGTLVLTLPPHVEHGALFHSGIELSLSLLRDWARLRGSADGAGGALVVPNVAPGEIRFCTFTTPPERLSADPAADCPSGYLPAGGLLAFGTESQSGSS
jgi:hypothetical protein